MKRGRLVSVFPKVPVALPRTYALVLVGYLEQGPQRRMEWIQHGGVVPSFPTGPVALPRSYALVLVGYLEQGPQRCMKWIQQAVWCQVFPLGPWHSPELLQPLGWSSAQSRGLKDAWILEAEETWRCGHKFSHLAHSTHQELLQPLRWSRPQSKGLEEEWIHSSGAV